MKAVNDYRILMPNIPYYATGLQFNEFSVVYYTGINPGNYSYTGPNGSFNVSESVAAPFSTGYYYAKRALNSGDNRFFQRPDAIVTGPYSNPWTQDFFFVPCYGSTVSFSANYYENEYQDRYKTILGKSANTVFVSANLEFKNITDDELKALNHFYQRYYTESPQSNGQGKTTVNISLFPPHTLRRPFYLKSIQNDYQNVDANNVTLALESPFVCSTEWKGKLIPFSSQQEYIAGKVYGQHDYVFLRNAGNSNGFYYFTGETPNSSSPLSSTGSWTQSFYFSPDLVSNLSFESKIFKNDLGNFYLNQDVGINPNSLEFPLSFSNRSDKEAKAILHFLEYHNGIDLFDYNGHTFFTGSRKFYAPEWSHTYNFYDNNNISVKLMEFKGVVDNESEFNSSVVNNGIDFGFLPAGFQNVRSSCISNSDRKYPITYVIHDKVEQSAYFSDFFSINSSSREQQIKAGGSGYFDIKYSVPQNVDSSSPTSPRGYFPIFQENEILGTEGTPLTLNYSGVRVNAGGVAPYNFLSGVQNCVASPIYQNNTLGLLVRWTVPASGYYFTGFNARISSNSGFSSSTGVNIDIPLNSSTYLYEIGTPGITTFETIFTGLAADYPYYVSVSGVNGSYTNHTGVFVYASGVSDASSWPNPAVGYDAVQSGLTTGILQRIGATSPSISISKSLRTKNLNNVNYEYLDLYKYITEELSFSTSNNSYSGIVLNFNNVKIGPKSPVSDYAIYETGSCIVTGNFSSLSAGIVLNLFNDSMIYGKGGSASENSSERNGKNALYINCSGILTINLDQTSVIAGGGGAGDNINFNDLSNFGAKFSTLKEDFRSSSYAGSGVKDSVKSIQYNNIDISRVFDAYNDNNIKINPSYTSTVGSSIFYDFFGTIGSVDQDFVLGGAGAGFGAGSGTSSFAVSNDASRSQGSYGYPLVNLLILGKDFYKESA